jgi:hypothetical protein
VQGSGIFDGTGVHGGKSQGFGQRRSLKRKPLNIEKAKIREKVAAGSEFKMELAKKNTTRVGGWLLMS